MYVCLSVCVGVHLSTAGFAQWSQCVRQCVCPCLIFVTKVRVSVCVCPQLILAPDFWHFRRFCAADFCTRLVAAVFVAVYD